jgi:polysaccharide pyruvyl transferase WcaK-like protein
MELEATPSNHSLYSLRRVALFGPYVSRNLGDTATQMAVIQNLRERRPELSILGISPEPSDTLRTLGIATFPISGLGPSAGDLLPFEEYAPVTWTTSLRRPYSPVVICRIARFVRTLDLLIVSGGGQLDDFWGGPWGHPWSMLLWTALAKSFGVPVVYLAVGLDGLNAKLSQRFSLLALRMATRRLFRDTYSYDQLRALGLVKPSSVCPDLAFSLAIDLPKRQDKTPPLQRFAVISPISRETWSHQETDIHVSYMDALTEVGRELALQGCILRIVCSQTAMDIDDAQVLANRLRSAGVSNVQVEDAPKVVDFIELVRGAELVVASRLHAVILALLAGCPVLALAHLPKVKSVMCAIGLGGYCLPLQEVKIASLCELARQALECNQELGEHIKRRVALFRASLASIFDEVVALSDASKRLQDKKSSAFQNNLAL